jgi:hypothetical protein
MKDKKITVKELLLLLKNYYMDNNSSELINIGYWEGGGDSGYISIKDDFPCSVIVEKLCDDSLDYGSWAGEFNSNGTMYYNYLENKIILEGDESIDDADYEEVCIDVDSNKIDEDLKYVEVEYSDGNFDFYYRNKSYSLINDNLYLSELLTEELKKSYLDVDYIDNTYELDYNKKNNTIEGDIIKSIYNSNSIYKEIEIDEIINEILEEYGS